MTPTQIKIAVYAGAALLAWWLGRRAVQAVDPGRRSQELIIGNNVLDPDTFGLTEDEIAARKANPAVDARMRELIDVSNAVLTADERDNP